MCEVCGESSFSFTIVAGVGPPPVSAEKCLMLLGTGHNLILLQVMEQAGEQYLLNVQRGFLLLQCCILFFPPLLPQPIAVTSKTWAMLLR